MNFGRCAIHRASITRIQEQVQCPLPLRGRVRERGWKN